MAGEDPRLTIRVRFLQLQARAVESRRSGRAGLASGPSRLLAVGEDELIAWEEAVEGRSTSPTCRSRTLVAAGAEGRTVPVPDRGRAGRGGRCRVRPARRRADRPDPLADHGPDRPHRHAGRRLRPRSGSGREPGHPRERSTRRRPIATRPSAGRSSAATRSSRSTAARSSRRPIRRPRPRRPPRTAATSRRGRSSSARTARGTWCCRRRSSSRTTRRSRRRARATCSTGPRSTRS